MRPKKTEISYHTLTSDSNSRSCRSVNLITALNHVRYTAPPKHNKNKGVP